MKTCLVTATNLEATPTLDYLREYYTEYKPFQFVKGEKEIDLLITGPGAFQTTYGLTKYLQHNKPDLCIQAGIAGSFTEAFAIGDVCNIVNESFADLGAETSQSGFVDVFQMGLIDPDTHPFRQGRLHNPEAPGMTFLPSASGITVNTVSGSNETITALRARYQPDVESMEGAAFFYTCLLEKVRFMEIRSISNPVEERNRAQWDIPRALENLNEILVSMLEAL